MTLTETIALYNKYHTLDCEQIYKNKTLVLPVKRGFTEDVFNRQTLLSCKGHKLSGYLQLGIVTGTNVTEIIIKHVLNNSNITLVCIASLSNDSHVTVWNIQFISIFPSDKNKYKF